jgi:hypothetical protein
MALFTALLICLLAALVLYGALRLYREFTRPWHPGLANFRMLSC